MTLPQYKDLHILPLRLCVPTLLFSLISTSVQAVEQTAAKALLNPSRVSVPELSNVEFADSTQPFGKVEQGGKDAAMSLALLKILPPDWKIVFHNDLIETMKKKVSWAGGDQWPYVLQRLLEANKLQAVIDWNNRRVSLSQQPKKAAKTTIANTESTAKVLPVPIAPLTKATPEKGAGPLQAIAPQAKIANLNQPTWRGEVGSTLKDTVFRWSATQSCSAGGNWRVIWDTPVDYRIEAPLLFNGDFKAALNGIFGLYQHAKKPLYAYTNSTQCLIKVTDK